MCWSVDYICPVWVESVRRARKSHRCEECRRTINPGERYEHIYAIGEDGPFSAKTCSRCARMREAIRRFMDKAGCSVYASQVPPLGEMRESLRELDVEVKRKIGRIYGYLLRRGWEFGEPEAST